jgi:hypothetical protein
MANYDIKVDGDIVTIKMSTKEARRLFETLQQLGKVQSAMDHFTRKVGPILVELQEQRNKEE